MDGVVQAKPSKSHLVCIDYLLIIITLTLPLPPFACAC